MNARNFVSSRNACKLCSPLGASLVFKGIEGCVPLVHGSQGCSTYIRRYIISHFREPIDIASSNFSESTAIFGGGGNLKQAIENVAGQYHPQVIGVATTCLSETIGDDVNSIVRTYREENKGKNIPVIVPVSTPSYSGTHMTGFHAAVKAVVETLAESSGKKRKPRVNLFPGFVSPEDIRYLKEIMEDFGLDYTLLPDYSETLDGGTWDEYQKLPSGGTKVDDIKAMGSAGLSIEFGDSLNQMETAALYLEKKFGVPRKTLSLPVGISQTDVFFKILSDYSGKPVPDKYLRERGRLTDSLIDGHKIVFEKKAVLIGEEDLVFSLAAFLSETGMTAVISATGADSQDFETDIKAISGEETRAMDDTDYVSVLENLDGEQADIVIGPSKAYFISRRLNIPLVRCGFPVHDRIGAQRIRLIGYRGAQELFDRIANVLLEAKQENSAIGYSYL